MDTQPPWDHAAFREYVMSRAYTMGVADSTTALAKATGIGRSMLSKWFSGTERPSPASLERLAAELRVEEIDLLELAGWVKRRADEPTPTVRPTHRVAAEADQLLSDDSPLSTEERDILAGLIDRVLEGWRPRRNKRSA